MADISAVYHFYITIQPQVPLNGIVIYLFFPIDIKIEFHIHKIVVGHWSIYIVNNLYISMHSGFGDGYDVDESGGGSDLHVK
jgi:hypothetical protein